MDIIKNFPSDMWEYLSKAEKPIVLYGTGDAAEKILKELKSRKIRVSGIFASDGFVRQRTFAGFPVLSYAEARKKFGNMIVLLCFGTHLPEVINNINRIADEQELYAPDLPIAGSGLFTLEFAKAHEGEMDWVRSLLADEQSRKVFDEVISFKLSGDISHLYSCETEDYDNWKLLDIGENECFMDLGAYNADTIKKFLEFTKKYQHIYAVEPDTRNFRKLSDFAGALPKCDLYQMAVSDGPGEMSFHKNSGRGSSASARNDDPTKLITVPCDSVDNILGNRAATIIKMDLEGDEPLAIAGASKTIADLKPKMLVSAYHRTDDLWTLPIMVLSVNPKYKLYLRHSPCLPAFEVNYFFI